MAETIGLQAVLEDENFQRGLANYMRGLDQMNRATGQASQSMTQSSGAIDGFGAAAGSAGGPVGALAIAVGNLAADLAVKLVSAAWDAVGSIVEFGKESILSAARVQELDYVIQILGERAGYSKDELDATVQSIRNLGIRTDVAQNLVAQFIRSELDLADATDLARVAQDAAVLSMSDSSDALDNLIYGITTQNSRVLRNAGVTTMAGQAMAAYADQLGIAQDELTPAQRAQAVLNGVIEDGGRIAGAYEAAMEAPGKQLRSFKRYIDDLAVAMGTPLLDAFGGALSVGKDIIKFLIDAAQEGGFLNDIITNLGDIFSGAFERIGTIVGTILAGEFDFSTLIPPEVMQVIESFVGLLSRLGDWWETYGPQIRETSSEMLTKFQEVAQDLAEKVLPFISEQFDKLSDWFEANGPLITEYIMLVQERLGGAAEIIAGAWGVIEPLLSGFIDLILNLATLVMQVFTGDWEGAWATIGEIVLNFRDTVIEFLGGLADWVAGWFGTTWGGIRTQWSDNWEMFKVILSNAWENIRNAVTTAIENIRTSISDKVENIKQGWQDTWDSIQIILSTVWDKIKETIREKLEVIFASMGLALDEMTEKWQAIWDDVLLIASTIWDRITSAIQEKVDALRAWWEPKWNEFTETLRAIWNALVVIITYKAAEIYNKITGKIQEIKDWWETNWNLFTDILGTIWSAIVTVVEEKVQEVYNKVTEKIEEIRGWIAGKLGDFAAIGRNLIDSMRDGVMQAIGGLISAVTDAVRRAVDAAKNALGIDSPSKVFMGIGEDIGSGLAMGITNSARDVQDALDDVYRVVVPGFKRTIDQIVSEMSEELSDRLSVGGAIGSLGGMAARMLEEQALDPLEQLMDSLDEQIEQARRESETAVGATARMAALEELTRLEEERAQASQEYAEQQERILELQKKQEQFAFLQQQIRLLDMIAEHGLDAEQILGGMEFGVDASLESIIDAMTAALTAIIEQTESDLGISSPSRVFARFGREVMAGLALGIEQFSSLPMRAIEPSIVPSLPSVAGMVGGQTFSNTTRGGDFNVENMNVNNGMDMAELRWFILETVREGI